MGPKSDQHSENKIPFVEILMERGPETYSSAHCGGGCKRNTELPMLSAVPGGPGLLLQAPGAPGSRAGSPCSGSRRPRRRNPARPELPPPGSGAPRNRPGLAYLQGCSEEWMGHHDTPGPSGRGADVGRRFGYRPQEGLQCRRRGWEPATKERVRSRAT